MNGPLSAFPDVGDGDDTPRDSRLPTLSLTPDCGSVPAGGSVLVSVAFTALPADVCVRGEYAINVTAGLYYSSPQPGEPHAHTLAVRVCASTRLGEVELVPEVDLGLSAIDKTVTRSVNVRNISAASVRWEMLQPAWEDVHPAGSAAASAGRGVTITFQPATGLLGPGETAVVNLSCLVCQHLCVVCVLTVRAVLSLACMLVARV